MTEDEYNEHTLTPLFIKWYLKYTEETEPPVLFHKWCSISMVASLLQRKCYINWGSLQVYPNLYIFLTAPPGIGKSQALARMTDFLKKIEKIRIASDAITKEALVMELMEASAQKEAQIFADGGLESDNHASLSVICGELATFLGNKRDNTKMLTFLTHIFDCVDYKDTTKHNRNSNSDIKNSFLNLIGGITPSLLNECLGYEQAGSGFMSRLMFIYADKISKPVAFPSLDYDGELRKTIDLACLNISNMTGGFDMDEGAIDFWRDWYINDFRAVKDRHLSASLSAWYERLNIYVLKLALIISAMSCIETVHKPYVITEKHLLQALELCKDIIKSMPVAFEGITRNVYGRDITTIEKYIQIRGTVTKRQLSRDVMHEISDPTKLDELLQLIKNTGSITIDIDRNQRNQKIDWVGKNIYKEGGIK